MSKLDFQTVSNNNVTLTINILDGSSAPVVAAAGMSVKWEWFLPNNPLILTTAAGTMQILSLNPLQLGIPLLSSYTNGVVEGHYPHEAVTVDVNGNPVTIVNNDARLTYGTGFLRKQLVGQ